MSNPAEPIDWSRIRAEFPGLERHVYLNTATYGMPSRWSQAAVASHFLRQEEKGITDFSSWFDDADRVRAKIGQLINARSEDIAFVPNAAFAMSLLMSNLEWEEGDEILTLENEFPNNTYYPSLLARGGVTFRQEPWENLISSIDDQTRLVIISTVSYLNGFRPPLEELAEILRRRNILFYVDATQSAGALQIDAQSLRPDMLVVHGYKWMLSPSGAGFLYVRPGFRRDLQPNVIGWRSDRNWRNMAELNHGAPDLSDFAEKYEGGMIPFALLYALEASVDMMLEVGPAQIENRVLELAASVRDRIRSLGGQLYSGDRPHFLTPIVAAQFPGRTSEDIAAALREHRVVVSARHGNLRISTHFYNNEEDLDRFEAALRLIAA